MTPDNPRGPKWCAGIIYFMKSDVVHAICRPRWAGYSKKTRRDPCDGCPLFHSCIKQSPGPGRESFNLWIDGINAAAIAATQEGVE